MSLLFFEALGRAGLPGRELAPRLDLVRCIGPGYAWREQRRRSAARSRPDGRRAGYVERWFEAAREVGAQPTDLSRGFVELRMDDVRVLVWNHWVPLDNIVTLKLALDKAIVHEILVGEGLPVPEHKLFHVDDLAPAVEFLRSGQGLCVVKPVDREGGTVTTTGIRSVAHLRRARLRARRISQRLLIERQVPGDNYRFLFLDGQLLDVVRRRPPHVIGDGSSTIGALMAVENSRRRAVAGGASTWELVADLDTVFTLESAGLTLASVPAAGERVIVKTVINSNGPEHSETVRNEVSEALVADVGRAVELLGVRLAGVDVITPDCRLPLATAGGVILEVNATPGLHYHYDICNPEDGVPVMVPILQAVFRELASTRSRRDGAVIGADS